MKKLSHCFHLVAGAAFLEILDHEEYHQMTQNQGKAFLEVGLRQLHSEFQVSPPLLILQSMIYAALQPEKIIR